MSDNSSNNKRIAKNTALLYVRMLFMMAVSLYTSRLVLATLGVTDYGLYNVVGSVVTMFVFIRSAMGNATNRYIAYAIGSGDQNQLKRVFSTCVIVHFILAALLVVLAECVGLWLFHNKMEIPADRVNAAFWAFQFSVATCALGVICVPYDAEIIAHEKMGAFAFMSILDVTLKLLIVFLLATMNYDKLILYGLFLLLIQVFDRIIYGVYCKRKFPETQVSLFWDEAMVKEMFKFASWNIIGNMAAIGCTPAINIFLNMFFGPVVNAARGVAVQIQGAVKSFVSNFQLAVIPQITKSYAKGDLARMHTLIISSSKFSYFLFFCLALPLGLETDQVLSLWLVEVPDHTANFMRLVLFIMLVESWEQPLHTANLATGKLKKFQTVKGITLLSMLPIIYLFLIWGVLPEIVFVIQFLVTITSLIIQVYMLKSLIQLPVLRYFKEVFGRSAIITVVSSVIPFVLFKSVPENFGTMIFVCFVAALSVLLFTYLLGLNKSEKQMIDSKLQPVLKKIGIHR